MGLFWNLFWQTGKDLGLLAILAWLVKSLIVKFMDQDVAAYKERLRGETDSALHKLRADLDLQNKEREIQFVTLHAKRAEQLSELYGLLDAAFQEASRLALLARPDMTAEAPPPPPGQRNPDRVGPQAARAFAAGRRLLNKFSSIRLYISEDLAVRLGAVVDALNAPEISLARIGPPPGTGTGGFEDYDISWEVVKKMLIRWQETNGEAIQSALTEIASDFRRILGSDRT